MELTADLQHQLHLAMKAGDDARKRVIRMLMAAIKLAEIAKGEPLTLEEFHAVVQKEIKVRKDALADAHQAKRLDLIAENDAELMILQGYLPEQFTEDELKALAAKVIAELGAKSPKEMGRVLKELLPQLGGRATNADASRLVKTLLEQMG